VSSHIAHQACVLKRKGGGMGCMSLSKYATVSVDMASDRTNYYCVLAAWVLSGPLRFFVQLCVSDSTLYDTSAGVE
jgi:hypothetical protein